MYKIQTGTAIYEVTNLIKIALKTYNKIVYENVGVSSFDFKPISSSLTGWNHQYILLKSTRKAYAYPRVCI